MAFFIFSFTWYWNVSLWSNLKPRCFWIVSCSISKLLRNKEGWVPRIFFLQKIISFACLVGSGLNDIFHLKALSRIFTKSLFSLEAERRCLQLNNYKNKWMENITKHISHTNVNVDLMKDKIVQVNGGVMTNFDVSVKNVMYVKKIMHGILMKL